MLEYRVSARRIDLHESVARAKMAEIRLDTGLSGSSDAFNPAEMLLAAIAACMIKGIERVTPMLNFRFAGVAFMPSDKTILRASSPSSINSSSTPTKGIGGWSCFTRTCASMERSCANHTISRSNSIYIRA